MKSWLGSLNNKRADQSVYPHNLISTFVIHLFESILSKLTTSKFSSLCSLGDWYESRFVGNPYTGIVASKPN